MQKPAVALLSGSVLCSVSLLLIFNSCGGSSSTQSSGGNPPPPGKIKHVVIIFQENRTPDNLFQDQVLIGRGADIVQSGTNSQAQTVSLVPIGLATNFDLSHSHDSFYAMYDSGKMDGADRVPCVPAANCPPSRSSRLCRPPMSSPISNWPRSTPSATGCFRPTKARAFPRTSSSSREPPRPPRPATCLPLQIPTSAQLVASHLPGNS